MDLKNKKEICISVENVTVGYEDRTILKDINFTVNKSEIFCIMGGSGCGKSTLLKHIIGLYEPKNGDIKLFGESIVKANERDKRELMKRFGVTYQGGALFGSMSVAENIELVLLEYTNYSMDKIKDIVEEKLSLVELDGYGSYMPSELSGGMKKRAGLARALALNPELLFFDEPSAGLDPISSAQLDRLILRLREQLNNTIVVVTHELDSVFTIADKIIMLSKETKNIIAEGNPYTLRDNSSDNWVRKFLSRDGLSSATKK